MNLLKYKLYVSQCATLEQSIMYYDLEHNNIYYCDGTNLKDRLEGKYENSSDEESSIVDIAIVDFAIAD